MNLGFLRSWTLDAYVFSSYGCWWIYNKAAFRPNSVLRGWVAMWSTSSAMDEGLVRTSSDIRVYKEKSWTWFLLWMFVSKVHDSKNSSLFWRTLEEIKCPKGPDWCLEGRQVNNSVENHDAGWWQIIRDCMGIDWKSRSGSIDVWNVEDKLSSWGIQRFRMDQQEEHSTRGGAIQYTERSGSHHVLVWRDLYQP